MACASAGWNILAEPIYCPSSNLAKSTVTITQKSEIVQEGQTRSLRFCKPLHVHALYIQATGFAHDAYAEVLVNGSTKGTLYVPGRDPHYVVTVEANTTSIEFASIRNGFRVIEVRAVVSDVSGADLQPLPFYTHSKMAELAARAIWIVDQLDGYTPYQQ